MADLGHLRRSAGQKVGIVGLGTNGKAFATRVRGFGPERIIAYDPYVPQTTADLYGDELVSLDALLTQSDRITVHPPPTHELEEQWADEYYIHALGVPNVTFDTIAHYWDRPMRLPQHTEAGCAKCHPKIADIDRFRGERRGQRINLGQHLFREVGCINCHDVDDRKGSRRVGPELTSGASKLTRAFLPPWAWISAVA